MAICLPPRHQAQHIPSLFMKNEFVLSKKHLKCWSRFLKGWWRGGDHQRTFSWKETWYSNENVQKKKCQSLLWAAVPMTAPLGGKETGAQGAESGLATQRTKGHQVEIDNWMRAHAASPKREQKQHQYTLSAKDCETVNRLGDTAGVRGHQGSDGDELTGRNKWVG